ncbi:MAG: ABC transporter ATP-binding protein [Candidatus Brockarchaeota archaeon]|nr:ABC transporter ATP-binding protein [Candidatus Brockarchaeota archaeon]
MNAIETSGLTKRFERKEDGKKKPFAAVDNVDLAVEEGELFGLLGPNGAGKTTIIKILCTLILPDSGKAFVNGYDVVKEPDKVRASIGWLHGETGGRALYWRLSARDNLRFYASLQNIHPDVAKKRIDALLEFFDMEEDADTLVKDFSTGMKVKVMLARTLLPNPPILLMDEPTVGLDAASAVETRKLLKALSTELGRTILFTSHNMFEVERLCERIAIMNSGKIIAVDTPLKLSEIMREKKAVEVRISETADPKTLGLLQSIEGVGKVIKAEIGEDSSLIQVEVRDEQEAIASIPDFLQGKGYNVISIQRALPTLEDVYMKLTREPA